MLEPLTEIERGILEYLIGYLRQHTYQPSLREIGDRFGLKSTKTTAEYLQALEDKGWIERNPARSRGIRILGLQLDTDAVAVPPLTPAGFSRPQHDQATPGQYLTLDRRLAGSTRVGYVSMPDDSLTHLGIRRHDLLIVGPVATEDIEPGDVVVTPLGDDLYVHVWENPPLLLEPPIGRVDAVIRRLRNPDAPLAEPEVIDVDAESAHA